LPQVAIHGIWWDTTCPLRIGYPNGYLNCDRPIFWKYTVLVGLQSPFAKDCKRSSH